MIFNEGDYVYYHHSLDKGIVFGIVYKRMDTPINYSYYYSIKDVSYSPEVEGSFNEVTIVTGNRLGRTPLEAKQKYIESKLR